MAFSLDSTEHIVLIKGLEESIAFFPNEKIWADFYKNRVWTRRQVCRYLLFWK